MYLWSCPRTRTQFQLSVLPVLILALFVNWTTAPNVESPSAQAAVSSNVSAGAMAVSSVIYNRHYPQDSHPSPSFGFSQFFDAFRQNLQQPGSSAASGSSEVGTSPNSGPQQGPDPGMGIFPGYEDNRGRRPVRPDPKKPYVLPNPPHLNNPGYFVLHGHDHGPPPPVLAIANSQRLLPPSVPVVAAPVNMMDDQQSPLVTDVPSLLRAPAENAPFEGGFAAELRQLAGGNVGEDGSGNTGGGGGDSGEGGEEDDEDPAFETQPPEPEFRQQQQQQRPLPGVHGQGQNQREPEPQLAQIPLGPLNVHAGAVTLSGFSSGGAFVQQLLVSHPSMFTGIGIFQQSFYRCGGGGGLVQDFDFLCTQLPSNYTRRRVPYDPAIAINDIEMYGTQGLIENPGNLANKRIYIYAGLLNEVFTIEMQMNIVKVLEPFVGNPEMIKTRVQNSQNILPTRNFGLPCDQPGTSNFLIGDCKLDGAYETISWLYGHDVIQRPEEHDRYNEHSFLKFDQSEFFQGIKGHHHMAKSGFIYIPYKCTQHGVSCLLHAYFHGCRTGSDYVGSKHLRHSGYLEVAELNSIVMLFPQVERNQVNYLGCWDSFGNTGEFYATQKGPQIIIVRRMIERLLGIGIAPEHGHGSSHHQSGPGSHGSGLALAGLPAPIHGGPLAYTHGAIANVNHNPSFDSIHLNGNPGPAPNPDLHYTAPIIPISVSDPHHNHGHNYEPTPFSHQSQSPSPSLDNVDNDHNQPAREHICNNKLARDFVGQYLCQDHGAQAHPHPYHLQTHPQPQPQLQSQPQPQDPHIINYNYDNYLIR